jgi:hypothetical protein
MSGMASTGMGSLGSIEPFQLKGAVDTPHRITAKRNKIVITLLSRKYLIILLSICNYLIYEHSFIEKKHKISIQTMCQNTCEVS